MIHSLTRKDFVRPQLSELVVNWHVTEACNYRCRYCYAHWNRTEQLRDVIFDEGRIRALLTELHKLFNPENLSNSLLENMGWTSVRLNIVGGEPLLYDKQIMLIATYAREIGMKVSMITNGSQLTIPLMRNIAPYLSILGLSLDSADNATNRLIGRIDSKGRLLEPSDIHSILAEGRLINPDMKIKLNTVVNSVNCRENMISLVEMFKPDRWKIFRMLPILNSNLAVSQSEFDGFVNRHRLLDAVMCVEDNADMTESYIMVDPAGRFFQNSTSPDALGYCYSSSILDVGAAKAFSSMNFFPDKFMARYDQVKNEVLI